jgi:hypothetical protein
MAGKRRSLKGSEVLAREDRPMAALLVVDFGRDGACAMECTCLCDCACA